MASLVAGVVTVSDMGLASFAPADPNDSLAGRLYAAELEASDEYTGENDGTVPADADRVPTTGQASLGQAARQTAFLNFAARLPIRDLHGQSAEYF